MSRKSGNLLTDSICEREQCKELKTNLIKRINFIIQVMVCKSDGDDYLSYEYKYSPFRRNLFGVIQDDLLRIFEKFTDLSSDKNTFVSTFKDGVRYVSCKHIDFAIRIGKLSDVVNFLDKEIDYLVDPNIGPEKIKERLNGIKDRGNNLDYYLC